VPVGRECTTQWGQSKGNGCPTCLTPTQRQRWRQFTTFPEPTSTISKRKSSTGGSVRSKTMPTSCCSSTTSTPKICRDRIPYFDLTLIGPPLRDPDKNVAIDCCYTPSIIGFPPPLGKRSSRVPSPEGRYGTACLCSLPHPCSLEWPEGFSFTSVPPTNPYQRPDRLPEGKLPPPQPQLNSPFQRKRLPFPWKRCLCDWQNTS
jgi:hypothetical protein